ncbi:MAG: MarR family transcriptional regulator [Crocinitomicaceae bacterium]|nr:MarR family transcriptional regulator [Crocinitomicaceae bacterium]|tara:strand:+ start:3750 stop:4196 length:447 start_codon:yes stop_codon:yes gene_type:complete
MRIEEEIKQAKFKTNKEKALVNLLYTYHWLKNAHNKQYKSYGISSQQYNVLRILRGQHPKPASIKLITERMLDKSSNASRLVDKLLLKGLVERHNCPDDRRQVDVLISKKGLELVEKSIEENNKSMEVINLSEEESDVISNLLDKMRG